MTRTSARLTANVVLASVGVAAAYVIFTTPPLRRLASRATRIWLGSTIPNYLLQEARRAWIESEQAG